MNRIADAKGVYAQSSDIKSRTYLQYRCDMKRKAIVELEVIDWFANKLKSLHQTDDVEVKKSGGDSHMWFTRSGKISGEPDYVARIGDQEHRFEFQYANQHDLQYYDFKVSKVGRKIKGRRIPHSDRAFLYIIMPTHQYAIFAPQWIMQNGEQSGVPAWGNRTAYRVPGDTFRAIFEIDEELPEITEAVDQKIELLDAQSSFIDRENADISNQLQNIVDQEKEFKIIPKTLDGFYKACLLMDSIGEYPRNHSLWLVYGASLHSDTLNSQKIARLIYSLDFLYGGSADLDTNVLNALAESMQKIGDRLASMQQGAFQTCADLSPREEVVNFLFAVNLYEDITQELRFLYLIDRFRPVNKIFQTIEDVDAVLAILHQV